MDEQQTTSTCIVVSMLGGEVVLNRKQVEHIVEVSGKLEAQRNQLRAERDALKARVEELKDALEDMASQFAYKTVIKKKRFIATGGLSALELCFSVLGWQDPHSSDELLQGCEYPDCSEFASCGTPTNEGYKNCCGDHFREYQGDKYQRNTTPGGDE